MENERRLDEQTRQISEDYITKTIKEIQRVKKENLLPTINHPKKLKKPFKVRWKEFWNNLTNTIS